ncbi:hypothetical protein IWX49DRAFT_587495 [Phyllosticta citricarpa]|uniref:Uncharacterized protein n=2 Tax=Phyllosticta TaxID=121621 RepID=A0ABR1MM56_9PEZI
MKSTIKKELKIDNTQSSVLTSSENFVRATLILGTRIITDRLGGVAFFKKRYSHFFFFNNKDSATGEWLKDINRRFEVQNILQLPWTFWAIMLLSLFYTSIAMVFNQNATELAEQRFHFSAITAGWYSSMSQYLGFFLMPLLGLFLEFLGNHLTAMAVYEAGLLVTMALCAWGPGASGTAAAFGVYASASTLGMPIMIDSTRMTMWYQEVFGSAYAIKIAIANAVDIVIRIVTGLIQDADNNSYNHFVIVYVVMAAGALVVGWALLISSFFSVELVLLQWTRK